MTSLAASGLPAGLTYKEALQLNPGLCVGGVLVVPHNLQGQIGHVVLHTTAAFMRLFSLLTHFASKVGKDWRRMHKL